MDRPTPAGLKEHPSTADQARPRPQGGNPFSWGPQTQGHQSLALAILAHSTPLETLAQNLHPAYAKDIIARLPETRWTLHHHQIREWLNRKLSANVAHLTLEPRAKTPN